MEVFIKTNVKPLTRFDGKKRDESLFYNSGDFIAEIFISEEDQELLPKISIYCRGDKQVKFAEDDKWYKGDTVREELLERNMSDEDVTSLYSNGWVDMNSWFEVWVNDYDEDPIEVAGTYSEAIRKSIDYVMFNSKDNNYGENE